MNKKILIYNGIVISETHLIDNGYVYSENGKIASIGKNGQTPSSQNSSGKVPSGENLPNIEADVKIDAHGNFISPGFIDIHTHGIMNLDFMESGEDKILEGLKKYTEYGVTGVLGTTLSYPLDKIINQLRIFRKVQQYSGWGRVLLGAHVEGPWLAPQCRGGHALEYLKIPEKEDVEKLLGDSGDVIKTVTFAPELPNSVWLAERLSLEGIVSIIGHTAATFEQAEKVILAGARHVTHMYDAIMGYRENPEEALVMTPGVETAILLNDQVSIELIGCPIHVPEPFFRFINKVKPDDKKILVTDSLVGTGMENGSVLTYKDGRKVYVSEGVLRMMDEDPELNGNLTGSAVTMNIALRRLKEFAKITIPEAVKWATINPAKLLGVNSKTGSIKVGKEANLVIFDEGFNIKTTILEGSVVYNNL